MPKNKKQSQKKGIKQQGQKQHQYYIYRTDPLPLSLVLDNIGNESFEFLGEHPSMDSLRYHNIKHNGTKCVGCGLEAIYARFEATYGSSKHKRHFNFYGVDTAGEEVLFTKDHILARSLGGEDDVRNFQTMCSKCNTRKSNKLEFPAYIVCPV